MTDSNKPNPMLKYSGLAIQMLVILLFFTWLGRQGDGYFKLKTPWLTILSMLLGFTGIMYKIIKDFSKKG